VPQVSRAPQPVPPPVPQVSAPMVSAPPVPQVGSRSVSEIISPLRSTSAGGLPTSRQYQAATSSQRLTPQQLMGQSSSNFQQGQATQAPNPYNLMRQAPAYSTANGTGSPQQMMQQAPAFDYSSFGIPAPNYLNLQRYNPNAALVTRAPESTGYGTSGLSPEQQSRPSTADSLMRARQADEARNAGLAISQGVMPNSLSFGAAAMFQRDMEMFPEVTDLLEYMDYLPDPTNPNRYIYTDPVSVSSGYGGGSYSSGRSGYRYSGGNGRGYSNYGGRATGYNSSYGLVSWRIG